MTIRHVATPNKDYIKDGAGIVNWFARDDEIEREGYFFIRDIKANSAAQGVVDKMSVEQNLKQRGRLITPNFVHKLNHVLDQVK